MEQEKSMPITLPDGYENYDYDEWLEFFRKIPVAIVAKNQKLLMESIPGDGYAAAARWIEISREPSKMDKLHKTQLKARQDKEVMDLAVGDDDEAFYEALIKENVAQLNTGNVSPQEVARLSQNINIFRKELREIRSRRPNQNTKLAKVLAQIEQPKNRASESDSKASKDNKTVSKSSGGKDA